VNVCAAAAAAAPRRRLFGLGSCLTLDAGAFSPSPPPVCTPSMGRNVWRRQFFISNAGGFVGSCAASAEPRTSKKRVEAKPEKGNFLAFFLASSNLGFALRAEASSRRLLQGRAANIFFDIFARAFYPAIFFFAVSNISEAGRRTSFSPSSLAARPSPVACG